MPANLDYESEALENSVSAWPRLAPTQPDPGTSERVVSAHLRGSEYIALSIDRRHIHCFISEPEAIPSQPSPGAVRLEKQVLRKTLTLDSRVAFFTVDEEANFCTIIYGEDDNGEVQTDEPLENSQLESPQTIEVRCLRTGDLALPVQQARLQIDTVNIRRISEVHMLDSHLLLQYIRGDLEVRRWRTTASDPAPFPVVEYLPSPRGVNYKAQLISPDFLVVASRKHNLSYQGARDVISF